MILIQYTLLLGVLIENPLKVDGLIQTALLLGV